MEKSMETLLSAAQVAMMLGISTHTLSIWRMMGGHGLAYIKVGGRVRYRLKDVEYWLAKRTTGDIANVTE